MDAANLRSIDLNLLVVLDVLLAERHVTRAGKRLGLSQPATSNALERLRSLFGDPLLERTREGLRPTPRAEALRPLLDNTLSSAQQLVMRRGADLSTLSQTVRFSVVDYGIALLVPPLAAALRRSAPGIDLVVAPWAGADEAHAQVGDGALDLAISVRAPGTESLRWQPLFTERYVVAMRRGHPALRRFTLERWLAFPHVVVSGRGQTAGALDAELAARGARRRVGLVVPSFLAVPAVLAESDLIAMVPARLLAASAAGDVVGRSLPIPVAGFEVGLAWHPRRDRDVATMHVARTLAEVAEGIPAGPPTRRGGKRS